MTTMNTTLYVIQFLSIIFFIFGINWMIQMLKYTKQIRIINSMTLKTILKYTKSKGFEVDIEKIQKEVTDSL